PPACGNLPELHPGNAPALRRVAATAQHHAAGAATVRTLNAGRTCAAVRPLSVATCRASSGQRASAAPGGSNGSVSCRWRGDGSHPERRAYLRSSAPPACGHAPGYKDHLKARSKGV
ncbi:hypothetical protein NA900_25345, partial [Escherichia coli]|nr:hypothetical protein [Escherichia coli]